MAIRDEKLKKTGKFILIEAIAIIGLIIIRLTVSPMQND